MALNITTELMTLLESNRLLHTAVLISFELPISGVQYLTDYYKDIEVGGILYEAGPMGNIGDIKQKAKFSTYTINVTVSGASDVELNKMLNSNVYINKKINISRAYMDDTGTPVPATTNSIALPLFEGVIIKAGISDSAKSGSSSSSSITWSCSSKFADFKTVNGRQTNDEEHRGLISRGTVLVPSIAAKKVSYQTDKGFQYANSTVAILANYQVSETKYKTETTKGGYLWR